jgi:hypothetical protein
MRLPICFCLTVATLVLNSGCSSPKGNGSTGGSTPLPPKPVLPEDTRDVIYAGFTFTGKASDLSKNFKYSSRCYKEFESSPGRSIIDTKVHSFFQANRDKLRNKLIFRGECDSESNTLIQLSLSLFSEYVAQELLAGTQKLTVDLILQILILDFRSKEVMATYPIRVKAIALKDADEGVFSDDEITSVVKKIYEGSEPAMYDLLRDRLKDVRLGSRLGQNMRIYKVTFAERCKDDLPSDLIQDGGVSANYVDLTAQKLSVFTQAELGVAVLPYAKDAANATMALNFADQSVVQFQIPDATYGIDLEIRGFKKVHDKKNSNEFTQTWRYLSYVTLKVYLQDKDPDFREVFFLKEFNPTKVRDSIEFKKTAKTKAIAESYYFTLALENMLLSAIHQMKADPAAADFISKSRN